MTVTNEIIDSTLAKLSKKKAILNKDVNELREYTRVLQEIRTGDDSVLPKDTVTGETMEAERRNKIFSSVVKRAQRFLGGN